MTTPHGLRARASRTGSLLGVLTARELRVRYRQSVLEVAWGLITPVATLAVYGVVLTRVFDADSGDIPYLSLIWSGMVVWMLFSTATGAGVTALIGNGDLVSKVAFPREVLPLSVVGASLADLGIGVAVLVPLVLVQVGHLSVTAVAAVPVLAVALVWTAAITVVLATVAVFLRDVVHAVRLALQVGFFATPVMYSASDLPSGLATIDRANPLSVCITGLRDAVLVGSWPEWGLLGVHAVAGVAALVGAILLTRAVEDRMVDVV